MEGGVDINNLSILFQIFNNDFQLSLFIKYFQKLRKLDHNFLGVFFCTGNNFFTPFNWCNIF
nr:MAG TPA: hypothetical protein [Caudoviricetes sp.]